MNFIKDKEEGINNTLRDAHSGHNFSKLDKNSLCLFQANLI